jgi:hypothetical protein
LALKLYADECVDGRIVAGVRRRSIDVIKAADEGLLGASDERHLQRAAELGRVILTGNQDFLELVQPTADGPFSFPGMIFVLPQTRIGEAVRAITVVATVLSAEEMVNWIEWVP